MSIVDVSELVVEGSSLVDVESVVDARGLVGMTSSEVDVVEVESSTSEVVGCVVMSITVDSTLR